MGDGDGDDDDVKMHQHEKSTSRQTYLALIRGCFLFREHVQQRRFAAATGAHNGKHFPLFQPSRARLHNHPGRCIAAPG